MTACPCSYYSITDQIPYCILHPRGLFILTGLYLLIFFIYFAWPPAPLQPPICSLYLNLFLFCFLDSICKCNIQYLSYSV